VRGLAAIAALGLTLLAAGAGQADPIGEAARHFERGELLYEQGRYDDAVKEFTRANQLASHWATAFNIARCHDNLGALGKALHHYRKALEMTREPAKRADIQRHISRIERRPVGLLVTTAPPGASITVDGRARSEPRLTPALLELTPGEHVLLLRLKGHQLAAARVVVAVGQKQEIRQTLQPLQPASAPARVAPRRCPPLPRRPRPLVDAERLHLHLHLLSAVTWTDNSALTAGPGVQLHGTYRRVVFGASFLAFITGHRALDPALVRDSNTYDREGFRRLIIEGHGGYMIPWRSVYFYATASMGLMVDRGVFAGITGAEDDYVREWFALVWGLGGGMEIKATRWLSFGTALRFGMGHGDRARLDPDRVDPTKSPKFDFEDADETHHFPFGIFWMSVTFHL